MHKKDLRKADGFPDNINRDKVVVVAVTKTKCGIIYYDKDNEIEFIPLKSLYPKFAEGIYILK